MRLKVDSSMGTLSARDSLIRISSRVAIFRRRVMMRDFKRRVEGGDCILNGYYWTKKEGGGLMDKMRGGEGVG